MQVSIEQQLPDDPDWQHMRLKAKVTLSAQVLVAWQMEVWLARTILEQQLQGAGCYPTQLGCLLSVCNSTG